jgi:hypothetical protein
MHASGAPEVSAGAGSWDQPVAQYQSVLPPLAKVSTAFPRTWGNINSCVSVVLQLYFAACHCQMKRIAVAADLFKRNKIYEDCQ